MNYEQLLTALADIGYFVFAGRHVNGNGYFTILAPVKGRRYKQGIDMPEWEECGHGPTLIASLVSELERIVEGKRPLPPIFFED